MGRVCTVCAHPQLSHVNRSLVLGVGLRQTAQAFQQGGRLSVHALSRHAARHISERARTAIIAGHQVAMDALDQSALRTTTEQRNLADLLHHREILEAEIARVRALGDFTALSALEGRMLQNIEQSSRLIGMLPTTQTTIHLVTTADDWPALQADLLTVARTVPAARKPLLELVHKRAHVSGLAQKTLDAVAVPDVVG